MTACFISLELKYIRLLVKKLLPLNFAEDPEWRTLMQGCEKITFPPLSVERVKHIIVEMYEATKQVRVEVEDVHAP